MAVTALHQASDDDKKKKTVCWTCGKTGHYALECRSGQGAGKGKGKKGAKGKGKGKGGKGPINSVDSVNTNSEGWYQWVGNWYQTYQPQQNSQSAGNQTAQNAPPASG